MADPVVASTSKLTSAVVCGTWLLLSAHLLLLAAANTAEFVWLQQHYALLTWQASVGGNVWDDTTAADASTAVVCCAANADGWRAAGYIRCLPDAASGF